MHQLKRGPIELFHDLTHRHKNVLSVDDVMDNVVVLLEHLQQKVPVRHWAVKRFPIAFRAVVGIGNHDGMPSRRVDSISITSALFDHASYVGLCVLTHFGSRHVIIN